MATARRDTLLELQAKAQKKWADEKTFEVTAPRDGAWESQPPYAFFVSIAKNYFHTKDGLYCSLATTANRRAIGPPSLDDYHGRITTATRGRMRERHYV